MSEDKPIPPEPGGEPTIPKPVLGPQAKAALERIQQERLKSAEETPGSLLLSGALSVLKVLSIGLMGMGALVLLAGAMVLGVCMLG